MPEGGQDSPQVLTAPRTRMLQAWQRAWQQYRGDGPRKLIRVQTRTIPAIRRLGYQHRVRR